MKSKPIFGKIVRIAALLLASSVATQAQRYQVGDIVQNFTLTNRTTGQPVNLHDLEGKIVFLEWFAYWCPFCQAAAADVSTGIVDYYNSRGGNPDGVPVMHVGVNLEPSNPSSTDNFINFYGFQFVLNDFNRLVATRFQSGGQPIFAIIAWAMAILTNPLMNSVLP
jgi:peroxiredoxin